MFRRVYLDNAATTPVDPRVKEAVLPYLTDRFGNASSIHFYGQEARSAVDKARHQVADLLGARPNELIFTSGGTESNNLAIKGVVRANRRHGDHIVTSSIEHPAVGTVCGSLEEYGRRVSIVPVEPAGVVSPEKIAAAITDETVLVSVMLVNNEIGTVQPVREIAEIIKERRTSGQKIWLHTDAVQAVGKIPFSIEEVGCDLLSLSGHKIYGPKGIGALYVRRGVRIESQNLGGHQERERRGGTENVAFVAGLGTACEVARQESGENAERAEKLRDSFEAHILESVPDVVINGIEGPRSPYISNVSFKGIAGEGLLINLDMSGVAVSTGSACSSGNVEPSHVIVALGVGDETARGSVRFSFGKDNTEEDVNYVLGLLPKAVENLRRLSPQYQSASGT
ncbi:MAG: cysteine desulfurase [Acidobacteria bacterium]|nr:MAG: cysteine desulfurase [Acidobacteriota bacterium]REK02268.1 MAG: cysteine desulfurase [Acidobacteriota bacterium]REK13929.1 MAG: cysteine desulfurase [Acidobacteriota bacterium]REK41923.1 MAG: cysteine desulfurase [Acidobacteriota bacterium]